MQPIDIHYAKMEEWLVDRRSVLEKKHPKEYALCLAAAPQLVQNLKKQCTRLVSQRDEILQSIHNAPAFVALQEAKKQAFLSEYGIDSAEAQDALERLLDQRIDEAVNTVSRSVATLLPTAFHQFAEVYNSHLQRLQYDATKSAAEVHFPWLKRLVEESPLVMTSDSHTNQHNNNASSAVEEDGPVASIDWGDDDDADTTTTGNGVDGSTAANAVAIQWDDDGACSSDPEKMVVLCDDELPPSNTEGGNHRSIDFSRAEHRSRLTQELEAASSFLQERVRQLLADSNLPFPTVSTSGKTSADAARPAWLDLQDRAATFCSLELEAARALHHVASFFERPAHLIELLGMKQLFRQKEQWLQKVEAMDRLVNNAMMRSTQQSDRLAVVKDTLAALEPQLQERQESVKELQQRCVTALSKMFPGREILMTGLSAS